MLVREVETVLKLIENREWVTTVKFRLSTFRPLTGNLILPMYSLSASNVRYLWETTRVVYNSTQSQTYLSWKEASSATASRSLVLHNHSFKVTKWDAPAFCVFWWSPLPCAEFAAPLRSFMMMLVSDICSTSNQENVAWMHAELAKLAGTS